ncbi:hypothetical protein KIN20_006727 [Parelaphostrongylus tenuis]|uniref:Uncharacterized protein n=1 Tax=Parelaphostrongylus tenuis TaxID=148309 RepID=A0AAD5MUG5_PARTN|nr:hypothetical protein KIN20_006727 [Parelaphostrongylus tenuis]
MTTPPIIHVFAAFQGTGTHTDLTTSGSDREVHEGLRTLMILWKMDSEVNNDDDDDGEDDIDT